jgi:hypothetical protein
MPEAPSSGAQLSAEIVWDHRHGAAAADSEPRRRSCRARPSPLRVTLFDPGVTLFGCRVTLAAQIVTSIFEKRRRVTPFQPAA